MNIKITIPNLEFLISLQRIYILFLIKHDYKIFQIELIKNLIIP